MSAESCRSWLAQPWLAAAVGAAEGYAVLALVLWWLRSACLPVSVHETKWQCDIVMGGIAAAYFAAGFFAAWLARVRKAAAGFGAFLLLLAGHAFLPALAMVSFGKRWYMSEQTLLFALIPVLAGVGAAVMAARRPAAS